MSEYTYYASKCNAKLDSDVYTGGGTDDTEALQAILDLAPKLGRLHLIVDGAALVSGLRIHSNTTIECPTQSCGFFLRDNSNCSILQNANITIKEIIDKNITLTGGTYNHNCKNQEHDVPCEPDDLSSGWVVMWRFFGVENLLVKDVVLRNQRTFALLCGNFLRVTMENITIELPDYMECQNQDGLHFWGPGRYLTLKNIQGRSGDDFIALAPDEYDFVSDITDVLIDGVFLDEADQGIRLLSRDKGKLDRVIIRNVVGSYKSFGFFVNCWFEGSGGDYGTILFENICLKPLLPNYDYTNPFLFRFGGRTRHITLRNIYVVDADDRTLFEFGMPFYKNQEEDLSEGKRAEFSPMGSILIDGLHVEEGKAGALTQHLISISCPVRNLTIRNSEIFKNDESIKSGCILMLDKEAAIGTLVINNVQAEKMDKIVDVKHGSIGKPVMTDNIWDDI